MPIFTVDTTSDVIDAHDGVLSLREALARADATEAADTIRFADAVQGGTIVLAGSQLTVASEVTIDGGSGVTLDADGRSRVLLVQEPEGDRHAWITLAHLTITSGRTREGEGGGAGIYSVARYDSLDLDHVTVTGNRAAGDGGGISGFYAIGLSDSIVTDNRAVGSGGGISGYYVSLANSTVSGNEVRGRYASGGGISAGEHLWLVNSTVSDNSALGSDASGGGVDGHHVAVYDSTITGNRAAGPNASGGGISSYGYARLIGSTISGNQAKGSNANGGGIGGGEQYIYNSIVAGNAATANADADVYGFVYSNGANIFGSRVAGSLPSDGQDIQPDKIFAAVDPRTGGGLLADNSGPTQTIALRDADDNPALGRGDPDAAFETDQRGEARPEPDDTRPDIGAFELDQSDPQPPPVAATFVVTSTGDTIADDGVLTLREALTLADADSVTVDRISFAPDLQNETIVLSGGQLEVHSDITIDGAGVTIDAHGVSRVLLVQGLDTDVTLRQLTLTGGQTGEGQGGGGIRADRTTSLTLDHVSVVSNISADADGGGIWANDVTLIGSTVSGNSTTGHFARGGGIFGYFGSDVTLINSTVSGNSTTGASAEGGGIYGTHIRLTNSTVNRNSTTGHQSGGGGIHGDDVTLLNSTVSGNSTTGNGFRDDFSYRSGGGGGILGTGVTLINSTVTGNSTAGIYAAGGGIETSNSFFFRLSISNSIVAGNATAASPGQDIAPNPNPGSYSPGRSISSNGHNIFGSDIEGNVAGDLENVPAGLLFAGGLADHGGPTWTIALRDDPTNPALGAADPTSAPATDQRGVTRPLPGGTNPDIGAFEHAALPLDGLQYIASYEDLIRALGPDEAAGEAHYRNYGAAEGRQVGFDGLEYVASYGDLIVRLGADRDAGSSHFIRHGLDEGRRTSFDGLEYIASFADLIAALGADRAAGSRHFIEHGAAEGRQVSFDGLQYIASYGDLIQALGPNADAGAVHFIRNGEAEGRVRDEFDEVQYLRNYADLQAAFGDDIEAATRHFITYGFAEGRTDHPLAAAADFLL